MSKLELFYPVDNVMVTQVFGENKYDYSKFGMIGHNGWDFYVPVGSPVRAAHDGVVVFCGEDGPGGLRIDIRTTDEEYKTIYCHLSRFAVTFGTEVKVGDVIAYSGNTGTATTGPHLHLSLKPVTQKYGYFENDMQWNGYLGAIDPSPYWNTYLAKNAQTIFSILNQQITILQKVYEIYKLMLKN